MLATLEVVISEVLASVPFLALVFDPDDAESAYFDHSGGQPADRAANARETPPPAQTTEAQPS